MDFVNFTPLHVEMVLEIGVKTSITQIFSVHVLFVELSNFLCYLFRTATEFYPVQRTSPFVYIVG